MRTALFFIVLLMFSLGCEAVAQPGKRVALVIGNAEYSSGPLQNPVNDANDMSDVLKDLNFDVIKRTNVDKRDMLAALNDFAKKLSRADVGLFYFAGHGIQLNGTNFLIPVKTDISSAADVEFEGVHAGRIMRKMAEAHTQLNVIILDACRNNPFRGLFRSQERGLGRMDVPVGTIVAYATSPGNVAADGTGRNGLYTKHLIGALAQPGLNIQEVFNTAGLEVMRETRMKQVPWFNSSPMQPIYLAGESSPGQKVEETTASQPPPADADRGRLKIISNPADADVFIDDVHAGKTPLEIGGLSEGTVMVKVIKKGYYQDLRTVSIRPDRKSIIEMALVTEQKRGRLTVETTPAGATVRILNIKPAYRPGMELEEGRYHVEVSNTGYRTDEQWVSLKAGEPLTVSIELVKDSERFTKKKAKSSATGSAASSGSQSSMVISTAQKTPNLIKDSNGFLIDEANKLMWAKADNGGDIDWEGARRYCRNLSSGGYSDWQMPTVVQLKRLYQQGIRYGNSNGNLNVRLSQKRIWASDSDEKQASMLNFSDGGELDMFKKYDRRFRVLPVRRLN